MQINENMTRQNLEAKDKSITRRKKITKHAALIFYNVSFPPVVIPRADGISKCID
jgi:hypothetical protein